MVYLDTTVISEDEFIVAVKAVFNIFDRWTISDQNQQTLLSLETPTDLIELRNNSNNNLFKADLLERISCILGIWKSLKILIPDNTIADQWINRNNHDDYFQGSSPLGMMMSGKLADIYGVKAYLESQLY